ncbi:MAG: hypothetical protein G8345_12220, partial [Magnetococcales bacterium]|nr:hypothetical protein [Magnetococcales bacterium]
YPPPPETFYTNFQAKNEVRSILSRKGLTHKRLDEMIAEYKEARDQGIISADEWVKYADQLEDIRSRHLERLEEMVKWFMDEYYRVFDEKLHVVTKIKLTNTRIWQDNQRQEEVQQVMSLPCKMPLKRPKR